MKIFSGKVKRKLGMGSIIASAFFLFNPDIAIIDIIPDVFGYLLLIFGMSQLSEINEKISDAKRCFMKAAICNAVKFGLIIVLFGLVTPREMPVSMLLFTFVMNIFDLIYVIPGYINLFGGMLFLGERLDGTFVLGRKIYPPKRKKYNGMTLSEAEEKEFEARELRRERRRREKNAKALSNTEKFCRTTIIFVIFKAVTPVLPEFTALFDSKYNDAAVNYYDYIFLYRTLAIFVLFAVGLIWLVSALRYYIGVMHDKKFIEALKEKYRAEVIPKKVYFAKKYTVKVRTILICAAFFLINIYFDEFNIVPDIISAIILAVAAYKVRYFTGKWKLALASSVLMIGTSSFLEIFRIYFNRDYIKEQILRNPEVYKAFEKLLYTSVFHGIITAFAIISLLLIAADIVKKYTGYFTEGTDAFDPVRATEELHSELLRPIIVTGIIGLAVSLRVPMYFVAMLFRFEVVWIFDIVFSLLFAFRYMQNLLDITANINYRHFLGDE